MTEMPPFTLPYSVFDQNALRKPAQWSRALNLARDHGVNILLPDVAMVEMTKSADFERCVRQSLEQAALVPGRVFLGSCIADILRREFMSGRPEYQDLVDHTTTPALHSFLGEIGTSQTGPLWTSFVDAVKRTQGAARDQYLDANRLKCLIVQMCENLRPLTSWTKVSRDEDERRQQRAELLAIAEWDDLLERALVGAQVTTPERAAELSRTHSVTRRSFQAECVNVVRWLELGGLESAKNERIVNDRIDIDYVVTASFCNDFISEDANALDTYKTLRLLQDCIRM